MRKGDISFEQPTTNFTNTGFPIWQAGSQPDEGTIAGTRAIESNLVPCNRKQDDTNKDMSCMIYGRFSDIIVGEFGILDIIRDPYTNSLSGDLRIRIALDVDVAVRYEEAFAIRDNIKADIPAAAT